MKTRKIIVEIICLTLLLNFFYEGIYKIAYWSNYAFWVKHAPLLKPVWQILTYVIPIGEIVLALAFMVQKFRVKALYILIGVLMVFVLWVMSGYLFTHRLFWPYHALWEKPTWMQKMLISIGLCWLAFMAIVLLNPKLSFKRYSSNSLRNKPANAQ
ncbi:MAG TPA: MauE/DoxX family redox-associated membrane protein [Puia sp.]|nr:MauE/DoxX family redox-associated membrane protein [Puia sp.]